MIPRKTGSETSEPIASLVSRGLQHPETLTLEEIRRVCASALVQRELPTVPVRPRTFMMRALEQTLASQRPAPPPPRRKPRWKEYLERQD